MLLQTDKRSLGAKAMLGEMRDLVEKRKAQEASGADVCSLGAQSWSTATTTGGPACLLSLYAAC